MSGQTVAVDGGTSVLALVQLVPGWEAPEPTITPIPGGITGCNFRVEIDGRTCVVRIPGERTELLGIDRAGEAEASRRAAALGLAPAVVAELSGIGTLVTEFVAGEPATTDDLVAHGVLEDVAASIRRLHESGAIAARFPNFSGDRAARPRRRRNRSSGPVDPSLSRTR